MGGAEELAAAPYVTDGVRGCGGQFKETPDDFEVEEVPAYLPAGVGEHLFLWVEKRGRATPEVVRALAAALQLEEGELGFAGLKDKQAVTRQFFSVPARLEPKLETFQMDGVQILEAKRHGNKLRSGHLRGNRFTLRLRGVEDAGAARASFEKLCAGGLPNYFGSQRFGNSDSNAAQGKQLLLGQRLSARPTRFQRKLYLSAFQSLLFNRALVLRVAAGSWDRALLGDVMRKLPEGGQFRCESPEVDQARVETFEISPAGPMFGPKMVESAGEVAAVEERLLKEEEVSLGDFRRGKEETEGSRRPYRVPLQHAELVDEGQGVVRLRFELAKGSYATAVLRELLKSDTLNEGTG